METSAGDPIRSSSSRLLVLMFTDLVDSTALKARIGIEDYQPLKARHDQFIRQALSAAPTGKVLQDTGDGYFISFDSIGHAIGAALVFQWLMAQEAWPHPFQTRVGLHLGEVEQRHNEVTGQPGFVASAIDLASRTMSLARGGQILLTRSVFDAARQVVRHHPSPGPDAPLPTLKWMAHGPYLFKGSTEPIEVFEVGAESVAPLVPPPDSEKAKRHIRPGDEETLGWRPAVNRSLENAPNWILTEKLGEGGFGEVWLAEQIKTHAKRVFKFCFDPERLRALKREVVLFRLLKEALGDRRDIAAVKDWQFDRAPYFIELDYCPAGNLSDWAAAQGGIEKVPLEKRLTLVAQIAEALSAAHSVGILHKDIKPSNVLMMVDTDGWFYPRLSDFGIGILTDRSRLASFNITAIGFTAPNIEINDSSRTGTRMYSPPESLLDRPHTVQGDVYALGVLLYQLAVGDLHRPLAVGWERDIADDLLRQDVAAALEGTPSRRLASSAELVTRLRTIQKRRSTIEIQRRSVELGRLAARRKRLLVGSGITMALLILVIIGFAFLLTQVRRQEQVAENNLGEAVAAKNIAREAEIKARSRLIANLVDHGFEYQNTGDPSLALLYFIHVLELDADTPAITLNERIRIRAALELAGRPVSAFGDEATHFHALIGSGLEATADGRKLQWRGKNEAMILNRDGRPVTTPLVHRSYVQDAAFSPDGTRVVTASDDHIARVWDVASGRPLTPPLQHERGVNEALFSPDGGRVITGSDDKTARVWDANTGQPVTPPLNHDREVLGAAFSLDGMRVVTASRDQTACVWDATSGQPLTPPLKHNGTVLQAAFSPDGTRIVTASDDRTARVWDAASGLPVTPPLKHTATVWHAHFSPDGTRVVTASEDQTARVWDATSGQPLTPPIRHDRAITDATFSPDGTRIVTASHDQSARIWDAANGQPLTAPMKHQSAVWRASFSPDGTRIVSASADKTARVWDANSGQPLTPPMKHDADVRSAEFSPDGSRIVTASVDWIARVWDIGPATQPVADLKAHAEIISLRTIDETGGVMPLGPGEFQSRWDRLTAKYPQEFFPPPNLELVDEAMKSKVMSPVLVAELGKWFDKKQQHAGAEKLLDFARQRGAPIDAALLARSHWQAGELSAAAIEFKIAIEQRDPVKDVAERKYLQVCLAAIEREARLEAAAVTATDYWWSTTWKPAGPRLWRKLDAETWQETDPSGAMKIFSIVSMGDPKLGTGLVVRCKADPDLEVWIPKLIEGNQTYYRRAKEDKNWHGMGGIHPGARPATPPTTQPTTATQSMITNQPLNRPLAP